MGSDGDVEGLREVEGLFDVPVVAFTSEVTIDALGSLSPREAAFIERAVDKRRREYATGRLLARHALAKLGITGFELLNGEDRAPIWPEGIAGTITHSDRRVLVAVAERAKVGTLGLDIEHRRGLKRQLFSMTLLDREQRALDAWPEADREAAALLMFSAKEALYKAQYPQSKTYMGFFALEVELDPDASAPLGRGRVRCTFQRDVGPFPIGTMIEGRYQPLEVGEGEVVTAVRIASFAA